MLSSEIVEYAKMHEYRIVEAHKILMRKEFCAELRSSDNIDDLADTLIQILFFEFGKGYDR